MEQYTQTGIISNYSDYQIKYAGFGIRFLAYFVDVLILSLLGWTIPWMLPNNISLAGMIIYVIYMIYHLIFWVNYDGATPGKKLLGIKIVKDNGEKLTYPVAFVRWLGYAVSAAFFGIGLLWIIWDKKKQAFHDKIAGTVVVKTDKQPKIGLAIFLTLIAIFMIIGFLVVAILIAVMPALKKSQIQRSGRERVISNIANERQPLTQIQADEFAADVFAKLNERRIENNLSAFKEDPNLCSYAQKRLSELTALGKDDEGKGFYEDVADPLISQTYFSQYLMVGTVEFDLNLNPGSTPEDVVNAWVDVGYTVVMNSLHNYACVRANPQFVVIVAGQHK